MDAVNQSVIIQVVLCPMYPCRYMDMYMVCTKKQSRERMCLRNIIPLLPSESV